MNQAESESFFNKFETRTSKKKVFQKPTLEIVMFDSQNFEDASY